MLAGFNFTLRTDVAALDLLAEVLPIGTYPQVVAQSVVIQLPDFQVRSLSLDALIQAKRTAGRVKDLQLLPELEALRAKQEDINGGS